MFLKQLRQAFVVLMYQISVFVAVFGIRSDELISLLSPVIFTFLVFLFDVVLYKCFVFGKATHDRMENWSDIKVSAIGMIMYDQAGHCLLILSNLRYTAYCIPREVTENFAMNH